jgi:60 kDa SS-A/Ro ribonucleoprotein
MQYLVTAVGADRQISSGSSAVEKWQDLERYLVLGSGDGIYFAGDSRLSAERAPVLLQCLAEDGVRVVRAIVEVARSGRAPRHDPVLFALALAASRKFAGATVNAAALEALPHVAHTAAHLKKFATYITAHRGWGRSLRSAFANWYLQMPVRELALQMLKQRRRGRWSHADLLRLSHPKPETKVQSVLFRWAVEGELSRASADLLEGDLKQVYAFEAAKKASSTHEVIDLIDAYQLTHEMIPERWLGSAGVWEALIERMPYCAMLRNLGRLTAAGLIAAQSETTALVAARLVDHRRIVRAKVSPATLLNALLPFRRNHNIPAISSALETAFYASFENVVSSGRRMGVLLDGAMPVASTILAMAAARRERQATILPACVSSEHRVDAAMTAIQTAMPFVNAFPDVEALVVVSGQSGWIGPPRPAGVPLAVVTPNATQPNPTATEDPHVLQIIGFDETVPRAIAEFISPTQG